MARGKLDYVITCALVFATAAVAVLLIMLIHAMFASSGSACCLRP